MTWIETRGVEDAISWVEVASVPVAIASVLVAVVLASKEAISGSNSGPVVVASLVEARASSGVLVAKIGLDEAILSVVVLMESGVEVESDVVSGVVVESVDVDDDTDNIPDKTNGVLVESPGSGEDVVVMGVELASGVVGGEEEASANTPVGA